MKIEDEELAILLKKLGIGIIVLLVFSTLIIIFFYNKFSPHIPKVITSIEKKETIYVFIENNSCKNCKEIKQILNDKKINYYTINIDKEKEYKLFLNKLSITENDVIIPMLMYIKDGNLDSSVIEISDEEILNAFIDNTNNS